MSDRIHVASRSDLIEQTDLPIRLVDNIIPLLNESDVTLLVLEDWLVEKKSLEPKTNFERVYAVSIKGESDDAWFATDGSTDEWVPKSQSVVVERDSGTDEIDTPSATLGDFGDAA